MQRQRSKTSEKGRETADKTSIPWSTKVVTTLIDKEKNEKNAETTEQRKQEWKRDSIK